MPQIGVPASVDTDLSLYFAAEADLLAFTEGVPVGTVATADDTGVSYVWTGTQWRSMNSIAVTVGIGTPAASAGNNGDIQFDFGNSAIYEKVSGAWALEGTLGQLPGAQDPYYFSINSTSSVSAGVLAFQYTGALSAATTVNLSTTNADGASYHLAQGKVQNTFFRVSKASDVTSYVTFRWRGNIVGGVGQHWDVDVVNSSASVPFADGDRVIVTLAPEDISVYAGTFTISSSSAVEPIVNEAIPAGSMGPNSTILAFISGTYLNDTGAARTLLTQVTFGTSAMWGDTLSDAVTFLNSATKRAFQWNFVLKNNGALTSQQVVGYVSMSAAAAATVGTNGLGLWFRNSTSNSNMAWFYGKCAADTASAQTLLVEVQHSINDANLILAGAYTLMVIR